MPYHGAEPVRFRAPLPEGHRSARLIPEYAPADFEGPRIQTAGREGAGALPPARRGRSSRASAAPLVRRGLSGASPAREPALWALGFILGLALTPLVVRGAHQGWRRLALAGLAGLGVAALYFTWHALFGMALAVPAQGGELLARLGLVIASFGGLFLLQALMLSRPGGPLARALYPHLFAGLYLDELFTRLTFRLWPPRLPPRSAHNPTLHAVKALEA